MACAQKNPLSLVESKACRERERINLLVHACHYISLFSFVVFNFSFLFFSQCLLLYCDFFLNVTITLVLIVIPPLLCTARVPYIMSVVADFYYFSL